MTGLAIRIIGLSVAVGFAALGRWIYLHPEQPLERFNPNGKPYGAFWLRFVQFVGALWLFNSVYGFLAGIFGPLDKTLSTLKFVGIFLPLAGVISWLLVKKPRGIA